jgi:hypothetical protein
MLRNPISWWNGHPVSQGSRGLPCYKRTHCHVWLSVATQYCPHTGTLYVSRQTVFAQLLALDEQKDPALLEAAIQREVSHGRGECHVQNVVFTP